MWAKRWCIAQLERSRLRSQDWISIRATYTQDVQKSIEEFAMECSIVKVWGSEMLERVVDPTLQFHGGYGYVEDFPAERAYRDARINRIFEGTNEINRLIISGWMLKRAVQGRLALLPAIKQVMDEVMAGPEAHEEQNGPLGGRASAVGECEKVELFCAGAASRASVLPWRSSKR